MMTEERISISRDNGRTTILLPPRRHALVIGSAVLASIVGIVLTWFSLRDMLEFGVSSIFTWEIGGMLVLGLALSLSILPSLWSIFGMETLIIEDDRMIRTCAALGWRNDEVFEREHYHNAEWVDGDLHDFASMRSNARTRVTHIRLNKGNSRTKICEGTSREEGELILATMGSGS